MRAARAARALAVVVVAALGVVACSSDDEPAAAPTTDAVASPSAATDGGGPSTDVPATSAPPSTEPAGPTTLPPLVVPPPDPACAPGPDRTITELPDESSPAVVVAPLVIPASELGDVTLPAVRVPGVTIPPRTLDGGCRIDFAAPGGCIGAAELSAIDIPAEEIPGFAIEAIEIDGDEVAPGVERETIVLPAVSTPAVRVEQTCEVTGEGTGRAIVRPALVRPRIVRPEAVRRGVLRPPVCVEGTCSPALEIPDVVVPQAALAEVVVPELTVVVSAVPDAPQAEVVETPDGVAFTAPADVLFDVDSAALRPDAATALQGIAAAIGLLPPGTPITVEGHADSDGDGAYNLELSSRRAQAVADYLVASAGIAGDRITTIGRGEDFPVVPNDSPEGKARNRRVVVAVATG